MASKVVSISSGNRAEVLARRDALVEANLDLVPPIARSILSSLPPSFELDDLIAAGNLGLLHAATSYRPAAHGDTPFNAYAKIRVRGAILDSIRRSNWTEANHAGGDEIPELAVVVRIDEHIDKSRRKRQIDTAVSELSPRHQAVINGYYEGGVSLPQVAERLGVCKSRASQLHNEALRELRGSLAGV